MSKILKRKIVCSVFLFTLSFFAFCQSGFDFQNTKVDDLSDAQIKSLLVRAQSMGYSEQDIYTLAQSQGYPEVEIEKLKTRIAAIKTEESEKEKEEPEPELIEPKIEESEPKTKFFGYDLFNPDTRKLSFETNLNIPVPDDYILGPQDELSIYLYGSSEKVYVESIGAGGNLNIPNIGPVFISGLSIERATLKIRRRLSELYLDLQGTNPTTFMEVSLSKVRNLKVNLVGELKMPGTYTVNGLASVFNAIYVAGGPTEMGTLREIKVLRRNNVVAVVDYYDFLIRGITNKNIRLQNDDIILVGPRLNTVEITGEVKRPGLYEMKDGEKFDDLLQYAGGYASNAYTERVKVVRNTDKEKLVSDLFQEQSKIFEVKAGDVYTVGKILERYTNRISVKGAVFRPGIYSLTEGMTVKDLISRADGLTGDAFLNRAVVSRTTKNLGMETIAINLEDLMTNGAGDFLLQREDALNILSIYDFEEKTYVKISGEVNAAGVFAYSKNMTVKDLIFLANGMRESAESGVVEISRRPNTQSSDRIADIIKLPIEDGVKLMDANAEMKLLPYDHIIVRRNPDYYSEKSIQVVGEVKFPGKYVLKSESERISDVLKRAGGPKDLAYIEGATLIRNTEFFQTEKELEDRKADLSNVLETLNLSDVSEADKNLSKKIGEELSNEYLYPDSDNINLATKAKRDRLLELAKTNPFLGGINIKESESIAIDLKRVLEKPGGVEDLILDDGDIINVPKGLKTIRMRGRVLYPNTVRFEEAKKLKYYIDKAGGFDTRAKTGSTYVVYANGEVSRTKKFLFFKSFPTPQPGSEVIVPVKPLKIPIKPSDLIGLTSGLATLALIATQIFR